MQRNIGPTTPSIRQGGDDLMRTCVDRPWPGSFVDQNRCFRRGGDHQFDVAAPKWWDKTAAQAAEDGQHDKYCKRAVAPAVDQARQQCVDIELIARDLHQMFRSC
jgi:hypothetical protein